MIAHESAGDRGELHVGRRCIKTVNAAIGTDQLVRIDGAAGIANRTAGNVEFCALLRDHFRRRQRDDAAECGPFADRMRGIGKIAAEFKQSALSVVSVAGVAAGAGRHKDEVADVDPDTLVDQRAAVAVRRRVAQLVALHADLDLVGRHRSDNVLHARHVNGRASLSKNALAGADGDDAALRHGQRIAL